MSRKFVLVCLSFLALVGCATQNAVGPAAGQAADIVFYGNHVLTVDPQTRGADAVAVVGDRIAAVGSRRAVSAWVGDATRVVELGDRALVPGFIDAHGHIALVMRTLGLVNASSPPVGPARNVEDIVELVAARIAERRIPAGQWVLGYGYDDSLLAEGRHPTRDDLDRASKDHPIALMHVSAHLVTMNSAALAAAGIDTGTPDPPGGVIRRRAGTSEPNGVLEEAAGMGVLMEHLSAGAAETFPREVREALDYHARYGVTTIQDGASSLEFAAGLRALAQAQPLPLDVVAYPHSLGLGEDPDLAAIGYSRDYVDGFRVGGVKFVLDGSPQGRTAWLTHPYREGPPGAADDYVAYPVTRPQHYLSLSKRLVDAGIPFLAHANGDAAIDLMIQGVDEAVGDRELDHRSVAIHAQLTREDQLDAMARLGIVPSYFAAHPFFWGDWHRKSFGDERASRISPLRSTIERQIPFTIHNDAPVVPPDVMRLIEIAVRRTTRGGHVLGPDQRATVSEALYAVTLGAAYQYFEEDEKGSITPGKRADLVVLSQDPRAVAPEAISAIAILETIARGQSVYSRADD